MKSPTLFLFTLLITVACGGDGAPVGERPAAEVFDSAGVSLVRNARPADDQMVDWIVSGSPIVSIGALEGPQEYQLFRVRDATRLADGRLVVSNGGTNELRIYDAVGTHLETWGGEGEGPGEFTGLAAVYPWPGDSLMAWDSRQRRMTVYTRDGTPGRTTALQPIEDVRFPQLADVFEDGTLLMSAGTVFGPDQGLENGLMRTDQGWLLIGVDGALAGRLGAFPGSEAYVMLGDNSVSVTTHPFGRGTRGLVWNGAPLVATNDTYELRSFDRSGELQRIVRRDHEPVAVTQDHLDIEIERRLNDMSEDARRGMRDMYEQLPLVPAFPTYWVVETDALGNLWVAEYDLPGEDSGRWTVYDPDGRVLGYMDTPPDLTVYEIGEDYILGRATDEFDIEYVQMYGLMRNDPAGAPQQ